MQSKSTLSGGGLGVCLFRQGRYAEAETELLASHGANRAVLGPDHPRTLQATQRLTELYRAWGRPEREAGFAPESASLPPSRD